MLRPELATEPVALAAIGCAATFLAAPTTLTRYKYAAYLTLVACHSLIFCQYRRAIHSSTIERWWNICQLIKSGFSSQLVVSLQQSLLSLFLKRPKNMGLSTDHDIACHLIIFANDLSPAPGHHGNVRQFYARIANIVVGVLVVLFIDLTCPW